MAIPVMTKKQLRHNFFGNYRNLREMESMYPNSKIVEYSREKLLGNWFALQIAKRVRGIIL